MNTKKNESLKLVLVLFTTIVLFVFFALSTYKQYGITSDEFSSYISGQIWYEYFQNKPITNNLVRYNPILNEHYRLYSMFLYIIVGSMNYELFHLMNLLFFIPVLVFAILLFKYLKINNWYSVIPVVFILLTPRILGDIPANPKDMPFTVAYFISIALIFIFTQADSKTNIYLKNIILGLLFGYTQSLRPLGFTLYPIYFIWSLISARQSREKRINLVFETVTIFFIGMFVMTATWPAIGYNFLANFKKYLSLGTDFNLWEGKILYFGQELSSKQIPWHYLPVWLFITTPISHMAMLVIGLFLAIKKKLQPLHIYLFLVLGLNLALYFFIRPTLYNGVRHYSFLVLLSSYLAGLILVTLITNLPKIRKYLLMAAVGLYLTVTLFTMYKLHPFENIYFNELSGGLQNASKNFDVDYWDMTYIEAANIFKHQSNVQKNSTIFSCGARSALNYYLGTNVEIVKNVENANYIFCNPREYEKLNTNAKVIFTVERLSVPLIIVAQQ